MSRAPRVVLLDIEGTTTPISFVTDVLFPYARERLPAFLAARGREPEVAALLDEARALEPGAPDVLALLLGWLDADRKAGPLKALQGMIWREGFEAGALVAPLYPDVVPALDAWRAAGVRVASYSSGSVEAQRLLYRHTSEGDLEGRFEAFFDTRTGPKLEAASYRRVAARLLTASASASASPSTSPSLSDEGARRNMAPDANLTSDAIWFYSDHPGEVAAAREAGLTAIRVDRAAPPELGVDLEPGSAHAAGDLVVGSFSSVSQRPSG